MYVLDNYCGGNDGECTDDERLLGTPIGNAQFVENFQEKTTSKLIAEVTNLHSLCDNLQTKMLLFKTSLAMKIQHLQFCDVLNSSLEDISESGRVHNTFVQSIRDIT